MAVFFLDLVSATENFILRRDFLPFILYLINVKKTNTEDTFKCVFFVLEKLDIHDILLMLKALERATPLLFILSLLIDIYYSI